MCKLTRTYPSRGCWIFRIEGGSFDKGEGLNSGRRGLSYALGHLKYSGHILCTHS